MTRDGQAGGRDLGELVLQVAMPCGFGACLRANLEVYMKMIKSLVLGSGAGLIAISGAQAADLPVKAKAVEYVRVCSLYGAGFWYIPGTDTSIGTGGAIRIDAAINGNVADAPFWQGTPSGSQAFGRNYYTARA